MSIRGSNFENQHPFASDHALVWERCMPDGLLYGVDMSFTSTLFTLGTGFMLVAGRMFEITAAENISISPGSGYARVYVAIDTGGTATENSFDQVSFGVDYAANLDSFAELTQGEININQGAAVYQAEVAVLAINSSGVTAIERQMELVSPGAGTGAFAAIGVTYPAGSTVTVTDGKITYTAPNTNGSALFIIPYAATWIVSATDGTDTASQTVEITTEGQNVSVELSFKLWLFKSGVGAVSPFEVVPLRRSAAVAGNNVSYDETAITFNMANKNYHELGVTFNPDITGRKTLYMTYTSKVGFAFGVRSTLLSSMDGVSNAIDLASVSVTAASEETTVSLDVSSINVDMYAMAFMNTETTGTVAQIFDMWAE